MPDDQDSPDSGRSGVPRSAAPAGPEVWKAIPGHKGYEASDRGRVRSVPRTLGDGRQAGGRVLKATIDRDGYEVVTMAGRKVRVHVAVCLAFHGRPEVLHGPGGQRDNVPGNVRWGSRAENMRERWEKTGEERAYPSGVEPSLGRGQQR